MADLAIRVEGLSKRYRIGKVQAYKSLRESVTDGVAGSLRRLARPTSQPGAPRSSNGEHNDAAIWALKDVSFDVQRGEVLGIIGFNGAGKSTLLKILSRVTEPSEGQVQISGRVGSLLEVGTGFHPELTGRENIYLNAAILGMRRAQIEAKFDEIIAFAAVEQFIDTPVKHFSSGMYLRLAFAVAAYLDPQVLLVDEVLAVGDAAFQEKCIGRMSEVATSGRTVLFVSHNMEAVLRLCSRVIWLDRGEPVADDAAERVVGQYLSAARARQKSSASGISLTDHPGRRKRFDGAVRLTHCKVVDGNGALGTATTGGECRVVLGYQTDLPLMSERVNFAIYFKAENFQRLSSCWSQVSSSTPAELDGTGEVECCIPHLPLAPGRYYLDVGCQLASGWADFVYEAASVDVADGQYYQSGRLPPSGTGPFLMPYVWKKHGDTTTAQPGGAGLG